MPETRRVEIGPVGLEVVLDDFIDPLIAEIVGNYDLDSVEWRDEDVVIDVGAHIGLVSMYLAVSHPGIQVYAYEPMPENFDKLCQNLRLNGIRNVKPHKRAVTVDGRNLKMTYGHYSVEATGHQLGDSTRYPGPLFMARSTSVEQIIEHYGISTVRLLKLDCEGAEHEILLDGDRWIDRVDQIRGEIHMTPELRQMGYRAQETANTAAGKIGRWQVASVDPETPAGFLAPTGSVRTDVQTERVGTQRSKEKG